MDRRWGRGAGAARGERGGVEVGNHADHLQDTETPHLHRISEGLGLEETAARDNAKRVGQAAVDDRVENGLDSKVPSSAQEIGRAHV